MATFRGRTKIPRLIQDLPPSGGFPGSAEAGLYENLPKRGPSSFTMFGLVTAFFVWGFYRFAKINFEDRRTAIEKREIMMTIMPLLQAEMDRRYLRWKAFRVDAESKIMKDYPGWEAGGSVYNGLRWVPPAELTKPESLPKMKWVRPTWYQHKRE